MYAVLGLTIVGMGQKLFYTSSDAKKIVGLIFNLS